MHRTLTELVVPAAELATVVHAGSYRDFDLAYGALATHVAQHAIAVDEPIREYFLVGPHDTRDETAWRTEICWPVFHTTTAWAACPRAVTLHADRRCMPRTRRRSTSLT
jgi:GyrI-like small molecule binding domain